MSSSNSRRTTSSGSSRSGYQNRRFGGPKPPHVPQLTRQVTPEEAKELWKQFNSTCPTRCYTGPPGPQVRPSAMDGEDGRQYMMPFESRDGNEDRNIPLQPNKKRYNVGEEIRKQLALEQTLVGQIKASFYAGPTFVDSDIPLPFNRQFLVVHFGTYCVNFEGAHPGEFAIASFSVRDGISQCYGRMLDPGRIPFGFRSDFYAAAQEKGFEHPGFDPNMDFASGCLDVIETMLEKCVSDDDPHGILYTARPEVDIVKGCLRYVAKKTGRAFNFKVFPMSRLLELLLIEGENLRSLNRIEPSTITFSEENAIALMVDGRWNEYKELTCDFHRHPSKLEFMDHCSMGLVKRWIYNSLELITKMYCCPMYLHTHVPKLDAVPPAVTMTFAEPQDRWEPLTSTTSDSDIESIRSELKSPTDQRASSVASDSDAQQSGAASIQTAVSRFLSTQTTPQSTPRSTFAAAQQSRSLASSVVSSEDEKSPQTESTGQIPAITRLGAGNVIDEEEPLESTFVTFQAFPNLHNIVRMPTEVRAISVFNMPDKAQHAFPRMTEGIDLVEFVPGNKTDGRRRPALQPLTHLTLRREKDLDPVSADFSVHRRRRPQNRCRQASDTESVVSGFSGSSMDTNISSVSKEGGLPPPAPLAKEGMAQATKLLRQGVLPQTRFVHTGKLFWEEAKETEEKERGQRLGSGQEEVRAVGRGRGRGHGALLLPPEGEPTQPRGVGRGQRVSDFWAGIYGRGRGRGSSSVTSGFSYDSVSTPSLAADDELSSVNSAIEQRSDYKRSGNSPYGSSIVSD